MIRCRVASLTVIASSNLIFFSPSEVGVSLASCVRGDTPVVALDGPPSDDIGDWPAPARCGDRL